MSKTAFVTGGSKGIGKEIVYELAKNGYKVGFSYLSNQIESENIIKKISNLGISAVAVKMSIQSRESVKSAIELVNKDLGNIDILVNNAAISQEKNFEYITDDDWNKMLAINLRGPFSITQEVIPSMVKKKWGRIINISSIGGQWGGYNQVHYAAAKAGLINFTRSIAKIYSRHRITSNTIAPGLIFTDMSQAELNSEAGKIKVQNIPSKRIGTVEDVGKAVLYLSSENASYITGQTLNLNGGMYFS
jgi:acetoacetyl-CoA reductase/3-oxoacyl-[acyl-carrier protein] reductase